MKENKDKFHLQPTSAAVLYLGQSIYKGNPHIEKYISQIDLSGGEVMVQQIRSFFPNAEEFLDYRKYYHHNFILDRVRASAEPMQVVILAAGYDPVSVQLLAEEDKKIRRIFEVDMSGFAEKENLFRQIQVPHMDKIEFIEANLTNSNLVEILRDRGFDPGKPAIISMEGITYYLSKQQFVGLLGSFATPGKTNAFSVEYAFPPQDCATPEWTQLQEKALGLLSKTVNMSILCYSTGEIESLVKSLEAVDVRIQTFADLEKYRFGANKTFQQKGEGCFEFLCFNI